MTDKRGIWEEGRRLLHTNPAGPWANEVVLYNHFNNYMI
jgi:hypothetical protein